MLGALALFGLAFGQFEREWNKFKVAFGKTYAPREESERFKIFSDNMNYISLLNKLDTTATYGVNKFADLSAEEFGQKFLGYTPVDKSDLPRYVQGVSAPESYDWEKQGFVNPVQDQGSCGSCWSFATTAGMETAYAKSHQKKLVKLSEQQMVDCDVSFFTNGCEGGNISAAERYIQTTGLVEESLYPYTAVQQQCKLKDNWTHYKATNSGIIGEEGQTYAQVEELMASALYEHSALPVAVNANPIQFYTGGILNPKVCNPNGINHAVLIVGYGVENGTKFWRIRNSWGSSWGEAGYFRLNRGDNTCGVAMDATYIDA